MVEKSASLIQVIYADVVGVSIKNVSCHTLSYKETALLKLLIQHRNTVLPRQVPLMEIWGDDSFYNARSMDVFMSHL
jgi:DNA-binding response OmpR family regulator